MCSEEDACKMSLKLDKPPTEPLVPDQDYSYLTFQYPASWTENMNKYCDKSWERSFAKTSVLVLSMFFCLFNLMISDYIGRRLGILISNFLVVVGMAVACFANFDETYSFYLKMIGLSTAFGGEGAFAGLFSIVINEFTRKKFFKSLIYSVYYYLEECGHYRKFLGLWARLCGCLCCSSTRR